MFGSMWQGKELEKKQLHNISYKEQEKKTPVTDRIHEKDDSRTDDNFLYQLVHERVICFYTWCEFGLVWVLGPALQPSPSASPLG